MAKICSNYCEQTRTHRCTYTRSCLMPHKWCLGNMCESQTNQIAWRFPNAWRPRIDRYTTIATFGKLRLFLFYLVEEKQMFGFFQFWFFFIFFSFGQDVNVVFFFMHCYCFSFTCCTFVNDKNDRIIERKN